MQEENTPKKNTKDFPSGDWSSGWDILGIPKPPDRRVVLAEEGKLIKLLPVVHNAWKAGNPFDPNIPSSFLNSEVEPRDLLAAGCPDCSVDPLHRPPHYVSVPCAMGAANSGKFGIYQEAPPGFRGPDKLYFAGERNLERAAEAAAALAQKTYEWLKTQGIMFERGKRHFSMIHIGDGDGTGRKRTTEIIRERHPELYNVSENIVVDIGAASLDAQKKIKFPDVPETFYRANLINMKQIADRSLYGVVVTNGVLDDLPTNLMSKLEDGQIGVVRLVWNNRGFTGMPEWVLGVAEARGMEIVDQILFRAFSYQDLRLANGVPVSAETLMALREINRAVAAGAVLIQDYTGGFTAPSEALGEFYQALRVILGFDLRGQKEFGWVQSMGLYNLTADVDPLLIHRAVQWFGWKPGYFGPYSSYLANNVPGYSPEETIARYRELFEKKLELSVYERKMDFRPSLKGWVASLRGGKRNWQPPDWFKAYLELKQSIMDLQFFDPQIWAMEMRIPLERQPNI